MGPILRVATISLVVTAGLFVAGGCRPGLEPAPTEIDDPIQHFFLHFDDSDTAELEAAITTYVSFLEECEETEDADGTNSRPECDLEQGLSTSMIDEDDIRPLIDDGRLADNPTEEQWEQAVALVVGRRIPITVDVVEDVLAQPNQADVFVHFEEYERTYLTPLEDYLDGSTEFLRTVNDVRSEYVGTWGEYVLYLDFRSLDWDDGDSVRRVVLVRSWIYDDVELGITGASVGFTFTLEILIPYTHDSEQTWRTQAAWSHADIPGDGDDHDFWENQLRDGTIDGFDEIQEWIDEHY